MRSLGTEPKATIYSFSAITSSAATAATSTSLRSGINNGRREAPTVLPALRYWAFHRARVRAETARKRKDWPTAMSGVIGRRYGCSLKVRPRAIKACGGCHIWESVDRSGAPQPLFRILKGAASTKTFLSICLSRCRRYCCGVYMRLC